MEKVVIRRARVEDLPTLYEFEQGIIEFERPFDETLKKGHINYYDLAEKIEDENSEVIVAEIEGELVGSSYISIQKAKEYLAHDHYGHLGFMFVRAAHRGKGINKQIIDALKKWARSKNVFELRLDVYDENDAAVRAYEKSGFKKQMVNMRMKINIE